jgi:ribosome-binding ATPase YchF (GTP1/OBG family)
MMRTSTYSKGYWADTETNKLKKRISILEQEITILRNVIEMTKAEKLGSKVEEELTDDDWNYIMTMGHSEYREYSLAKSKDRGYIHHLRRQQDVHDK